LTIDSFGVGITGEAYHVAGGSVLGEVGGVEQGACARVDGASLDVVGTLSPCVGGIDAASDRVYAIGSGFITELQLSTGRLVKRAAISSNNTTDSPVLVTKAGFAIVDADHEGITLLTRG
jgi:hypothetical protein